METTIELKPIGHVKTRCAVPPRHWTVSDVKGQLVVDPEYKEGIRDIKPGSRIVVLFHFHKSPPFSREMLIQKPPHRDRHFGVFSICSPKRPNPIGMSVLKVMGVKGNIIEVEGIDMFDQTPIIDIKPHIECPEQCPGNPVHTGP